MSLVKLLPAWFHAIADYAVGVLLIVVALANNGSDGAVATGVVVGAVVLLVSALTCGLPSPPRLATVHVRSAPR